MSKPSSQIRQEFIEFFKKKGHTFVPSSPVVPHDDPTLLFINAGMNQFKSIFLGDNPRGLKRAANSQKCMRVSGKHNDLEEVGRDHYHHTMFEMLGNWSFGDYYKKEAIVWAWELLTEVWGFPKDRLFATVYESDDEAMELWKSETDIDHDRILRFGKKDNFWEMGETGPCGPCSEIHYDIGDPATQEQTFKDPVQGVNGENDRYREIWNLVFIQYNREQDGSLKELPNKHVDTGMGFERLTAVLQDVKSNYDTDLFSPLIAHIEKMSGQKYLPGLEGMPFRVIADHIRALTFTITDGVFPSNEGRGYVLRRLLRRAFRYGRELGFREPFLYEIVPAVIDIMGDAFPEIKARREYVQEVIRSEEERFGQTLEQGILKFNDIVEELKGKKKKTVSGDDVFLLYDTYGFPMDLTRLMAEEQGLSIDEQGYETLMDQQRDRAREAAKKSDDTALSSEGWIELGSRAGTQFIGYDADTSESQVVRYKKADNGYLLILDITPFYAESGGQVGDKGKLTTENDTVLTVADTFKWNDMIVHKVGIPEDFDEKELQKPLHARIVAADRQATRRNHSATHLLQAALRNILGDHIQQSGSKVDPETMRFDFTHFKALTPNELVALESQVNEWILADLKVATVVKPTEEAKEEGAIALFGEKYGPEVRVVTMGKISKELCGGTHVTSTGQIGLFHITSESSISAGIRRIEAVTGMNAVDYLNKKEGIVTSLVNMLKTGEDALPDKISGMMDDIKNLQSEISKLQQQNAADSVETLVSEAEKNGKSFPWIIKNMGTMDKGSFSNLTDALSDTIREQKLEKYVFVLGVRSDSKALFAACAGKEAVAQHGIHCGNLVKTAAKEAGGGGGGSPLRAQAGGKAPDKIDDALEVASQLLKKAEQP
ncbi:MAG: alanine--tRNA ligase [Chitinivibrionales bacterium]|nr:alanine--tRNA ligase [Chitinivibrionales bacterium]